MADNRRNILRSSFGVGLATFLGRILGLGRVMLEARVLGGEGLAAAWQLAFMVPNLFRRLLGEGALGTALIPLISHLEADVGVLRVRKELAVVFVTLGLMLAAISVVISLGALAALTWVTTEYIRMALKLLPLLMPYTIFICLVGVMTAVANTRRSFFLAALSGLLLNILLIAVLFYFNGQNITTPAARMRLLDALAVTVLIAGVLHMLIMLLLLLRCGMFPQFRAGVWRESKIFRELFSLALPGLIGASAGQVSFLVDRGLACYVGAFAVAALNYTERLVYLPIGICAMALSSVLMADMSNAAARRDYAELTDDLILGLRYVWYGCAPVAVFLIVYREPLLRMLFLRGQFTEFALTQTADAMLFYAMGIPAFCAIKVILPAFYARKEMKTPVKVSLFAIGLNVVLSTVLMFPLRQGGIALATVLSAQANNVILLFLLRRAGLNFTLRPVMWTAAKALLAAGVAALPFCGYAQLRAMLPVRHYLPADLLPLTICGIGFGVIYLGVTMLLGCGEPGELFASLHRRRPARSGKASAAPRS